MAESGALVYKLSSPEKTYGSVTCVKFRLYTPELSTLHVLLTTCRNTSSLFIVTTNSTSTNILPSFQMLLVMLYTGMSLPAR